MKKFFALLCAVLMLVGCLGLTGCGNETIVVGYTIYAPMNYKNDAGDLVGFDTDLAKAVFEELGYEVIFKEINWPDKYTDLNSGVIDCVWNGFTCNSTDDDGVARADKVDFSYRYMQNLQVVVTKKDSGITSAADLNGKIVSVEAGSAGESYAKGFEGAVVKTATKQTDCLMEVNAGTADVAVLDAQLANTYCGQGDYANLQVLEALSSDVEYYAIGFKKDSELTDKVNAQLEALAANGTLEKIAKTYKLENAVILDFADQK